MLHCSLFTDSLSPPAAAPPRSGLPHVDCALTVNSRAHGHFAFGHAARARPCHAPRRHVRPCACSCFAEKRYPYFPAIRSRGHRDCGAYVRFETNANVFLKCRNHALAHAPISHSFLCKTARRPATAVSNYPCTAPVTRLPPGCGKGWWLPKKPLP